MKSAAYRVVLLSDRRNEELAISRPSLKGFYSGNGGKLWYRYMKMHGVTPKKTIFLFYSCVRHVAVSVVGEN
jgi:hypothetical protein